MRTTCGVCSTPFDGQPGYRVLAAHWYGRRWSGGPDLLICPACYTTRRGFFNRDHRTLHVSWSKIVGRGPEMAPAPCEACGQLVICNAEKGRRHVTCSATCTTSLTRTRNGNQGSGQPCESCGQPITTGRADSRYCGSACRQKAYRQRKSNA